MNDGVQSEIYTIPLSIFQQASKEGVLKEELLPYTHKSECRVLLIHLALISAKPFLAFFYPFNLLQNYAFGSLSSLKALSHNNYQFASKVKVQYHDSHHE